MIYDPHTVRPISTSSKADAHNIIKKNFLNKETQEAIHPHIGVLITDMSKLLVSVRPFDAKVNADLLDKTVGGHLPAGHENAAAILEVATRELQVPIAVVTNKELLDIILVHPGLLTRQAFISEVGYSDSFISKRITEEDSYDERCIQYIYTGVYNGPYKCEKGSGIRTFSIEGLQKYIKKFPERVTEDLKIIIKDYLPQLKSLFESTKKALSSNQTKEVVEIKEMNGSFAGVEDRKSIHQEIKENFQNKTPQKFKHSHIGGMLVASGGEVYVQIRSDDKKENPGKYDKIVGGHIPAGDTPIVAAYHEFIDEMSIPIGMYDESVCINILENCPDTTKTQAICQKPILTKDFKSKRVQKDGKHFIEICDQYFLVGYYDGPFKLTDDEAGGMYQFPNRNLLKEALDKNPEKFTDDLKHMIELFWDDLIPVKEKLKAKIIDNG